MATNQGVFEFSTIVGELDASVTISKGIAPSVTSVLIDPVSLAGLQRVSTAKWYFDGILIRQFPFSAIDNIATVDQGGLQLLRLRIFDRRWGWAFGQVSGEYNIRKKGVVIPGRKKSNRELADILFKAMGEVNYDYSEMPNDDYPYVLWELDNPAKMLSELCELCQCEIVLMVDNSVKIVRKGIGDYLPGPMVGTNTPRIRNDYTYDPPEYPKQLIGVTAPTKWQVDLKLEPVGFDTENGEPKPINDLKYTPQGGLATDEFEDEINSPSDWNRHFTTGEDGDFEWITDKEKRELAQKHIYKTWRITLDGIETDPAPELPLPSNYEPPEDIYLPGALVPILDIKQFLPLVGEQVETEGEGDYEKPKDAIVWGRFYTGDLGGNSTDYVEDDNTTNSTTELQREDFDEKLVYKGSISLDEDRGLVTTGDVLRVLWEANTNGDPKTVGTILEPELYLRCSVNLKHPDTYAPQRWGKPMVIDASSPAGFKYEPREDIEPGYWQELTPPEEPEEGEAPDPFATDTLEWNDNISEVSEQMGFFLNQTLREYQTYPAESSAYSGLIPINLDGAIQQVSYTIDGSGTCNTGASRNTDYDRSVVGHEEAIRQRKVTEAIQKQSEFKRLERSSARRKERDARRQKRIDRL